MAIEHPPCSQPRVSPHRQREGIEVRERSLDCSAAPAGGVAPKRRRAGTAMESKSSNRAQPLGKRFEKSAAGAMSGEYRRLRAAECSRLGRDAGRQGSVHRYGSETRKTPVSPAPP